jgi:hypothetical protein
MKRLGRGDPYCAAREGNVASRLVEPGTLALEPGSVRNYCSVVNAAIIVRIKRISSELTV